MKKIKTHIFLLWAALALAVIGAIAFIGVQIYHYNFGMLQIDTAQSAPALEESEYNLVYRGEYNGKAIKIEGQIFLDMDVVNLDWAEGMLFYAKDVGKVFYTTYTEMTEYIVEEDGFTVWNDQIYISGPLAKEMFGTQYKVNESENMVALQAPGGKVGEVMDRSTYLLQSPSEDEQNYSAKLKRGETIALFDCDEEGYYYAMSDDGYTGYVAEERLSISENLLSVKSPTLFELDDLLLPWEPVRIGWQQVYTSVFTAEVYAEASSPGYYINVISPTWFKIGDEGQLISLANEEYVTWAQDSGLQVWALFDNQFDDELTREVLDNTEKRQALVSDLLEYCERYDLNGINVDFEGMEEETMPCYTQFMRELSITLRQHGYILTVDVPVPSQWSDYYPRDVLYNLCDYVIVMAYDEHYAGDTTAGSTASQKFTAEAIYNMMQEGVGRDKLILGVPFYTRIWKGTDDLTSEAVSMESAWDCIYENGLEVTYDKETGQNYAEGKVGGTLYRIWLEDTTSMGWRMKLMLDNDLAGIAAWSLGYEDDDIWTVYEEAFY